MAAAKGSLWGRLGRNAGSSVGGFAVHILVTFFLFPFTVSHIGPGAYGILVLVSSVVGYSGLLSFGLRPTLVKRSAEYLATDDREAFHRVTGQILFVYSAVAGVVLVCTGLGLWLLPAVLNVRGEQVELFRTVMLLVGVQAAISLPGTVWAGLVEGLEDYHFSAATRIGAEAVKVVSTIVLLLAGYGLVALVVVYLVISVLQFLAAYAWVRRRLPWTRIRPALGTREELGSLMRFSGLMFVLSFSGSSENVMDKLILGSLTTPVLVTTYEVGNRLSTYAHQFIIQITRVLVPTASALSASRDVNALRRVLVVGSRSVVFLHGMLMVGLLAFGREFIHLWMGPEYAQAYPVLVLLVLSVFAAAHITVPWALCYGTGDLRVLSIVSVSRMVLNVALSAVLVLRWGIVGVAMGTLVSRALQAVFLLPYFSRLFDIRLAELVTRGFVRSWLALGVAGAAAWALRENVLQSTWASLVAVSLLTGALGGAAFWVVSLSGAERSRLRSYAAARLLPNRS